jgi:hypothetical protein
MKIAVLIDFTEGSKIALQQACLLAAKTSSTIVAINIIDSKEKLKEAESNLKTFIERDVPNNINHECIVEVGNLFESVESLLQKIEPSLVMICTHGVKGMFQHLFGAYIFKLIQTIHFPTIVLQENNISNIGNIKNILLPIGPHENFELKVKQTTELAKLLGSKIFIYEINKIALETDKIKVSNLNRAKEYFTKNNVEFEKIVEDFDLFSVGFAKQTLKFAADNSMNIISLMTTVSENELMMKVADKENFLVNTYGIPILCCN